MKKNLMYGIAVVALFASFGVAGGLDSGTIGIGKGTAAMCVMMAIALGAVLVAKKGARTD